MKRILAIAAIVTLAASGLAIAQDEAITVEGPPPELTGLKAEAARMVSDKQKLTQEIVDSLFSFSELGFQEFETQRYLTGILEENGFTVEHGASGIPSAWWATWGSGKPVIALGSDVDGIPKSSQMPGVAYRKPMVEGAPGHGDQRCAPEKQAGVVDDTYCPGRDLSRRENQERSFPMDGRHGYCKDRHLFQAPIDERTRYLSLANRPTG